MFWCFLPGRNDGLRFSPHTSCGLSSIMISLLFSIIVFFYRDWRFAFCFTSKRSAHVKNKEKLKSGSCRTHTSLLSSEGHHWRWTEDHSPRAARSILPFCFSSLGRCSCCCCVSSFSAHQINVRVACLFLRCCNLPHADLMARIVNHYAPFHSLQFSEEQILCIGFS
jgi:hypothetical protein